MPETYPAPTARAWDNFSQYVPLLLGAIDAELNRPDVWESADRADALYYIDDLKCFLLELETILMSQQTVTEIAINPATTYPALLKTLRAGETIDEVLLTVDEAFDTGTLSIGDESDHERFMSAGLNSLTASGQFQSSPQTKVEAETEVYIYLTGTPVTGSGRVTLYTYQEA